MIFSQPVLPNITGTPRQISFCPYSPSKETQQVNTFFSSRTMLSTKANPAAPGAYHAEVPMSLVSVAPPTIVSADTFFKVSASSKLLTGLLFKVARRVNGIIVVSPCPPTTTAFKSPGEQFNACDK